MCFISLIVTFTATVFHISDFSQLLALLAALWPKDIEHASKLPQTAVPDLIRWQAVWKQIALYGFLTWNICQKKSQARIAGFIATFDKEHATSFV